MFLSIYSNRLGLFGGPECVTYYWVSMIISKAPAYFYGQQLMLVLVLKCVLLTIYA